MRRHKGKMHDYLYNFQRSWWNQVDPDVKAYNDATGTNLPAIETLVKGLKADGLWSKVTNLYPFPALTSSANAVNLITPGVNNMTIPVGASYSTLGINTNADTTGCTFDAPIIVETVRSLGIHIKVTSNAFYDVGDVHHTSDPNCRAMVNYSPGVAVFLQFFSFANDLLYSPPISTGITHMTRGSDGNKIYQNGVLKASGPVGSANGLAVTNWTFGRLSNRTYGILAYTTQMTDSEVTLLYGHLNTYCTSMGR